MIWAVFLAVLALLALLGRTRLGLRGVYTPEEVGVWLRIGGVSRRLYPPKASSKPKKKREKAPPSKKEAEGEAPRLTPGGLYRLAGELLPLAWQGAGDLRRRLQVDRLRLEVVAAAAFLMRTRRSSPIYRSKSSKGQKKSTRIRLLDPRRSIRPAR